MSISKSPVLPWAVVEPEGGEPKTCQEEMPEETTVISVEDAGLEVGRKIEVKWKVTPTEGEAYDKWWGATIHAAEAANAELAPEHQEFQHVYQLRYDADEGFESECCHVAFLGEHWLMDLSTDTDLAFRKPGDSWEPETLEEGSSGSGDEDEAEGIDERDLPFEQAADGTFRARRMESEADRTRNLELLTADAKDLMAGMDTLQQHFVASGVRDLMDAIGDLFHKKAESEGVVEAEDVQEMFRNLREKRPRLS